MIWKEFRGPYQRDGQLLSDTFMLRCKLLLRVLVNDLADSKDMQIEDWFEALDRNLLEPLPAANMSTPTS